MDSTHPLTYEGHAAVAVKKMQGWLLVTSLVGFGLYALVFAPLYTQLASNISYSEALITYVLSYALSIAELATYYIAFAVTIFAIWRGGFLGARSVWITFSLAILGKYVANFFMDCILDGSIPAWSYFVSRDLPIILPNFLLEWGQYALVVLMAALIIRGRKRKWQMDVLLDGPKAGEERSLAFPILKLLSFRNPVLASAFATAILLFVAKAFSHLMYQLAQLVYTGKFEGAAVLIMDLVSDLLLAVLAYFVMALLLSFFDKHEMQDMAKAQEP